MLLFLPAWITNCLCFDTIGIYCWLFIRDIRLMWFRSWRGSMRSLSLRGFKLKLNLNWFIWGSRGNYWIWIWRLWMGFFRFWRNVNKMGEGWKNKCMINYPFSKFGWFENILWIIISMSLIFFISKLHKRYKPLSKKVSNRRILLLKRRGSLKTKLIKSNSSMMKSGKISSLMYKINKK